MKCLSCKIDLIEERSEGYKYTESGLKNVIIMGINTFRCPKCEAVLAKIPNIAGLHLAIATSLLVKPSRLSGAEIRFLRKNIPMQANELAKALGYSPARYSRIETGKNNIGDQGDRLVRLWFLEKKRKEIQRYRRELKSLLIEKPEAILNQFEEGIAKESRETPIEISAAMLSWRRQDV